MISFNCFSFAFLLGKLTAASSFSTAWREDSFAGVYEAYNGWIYKSRAGYLPGNKGLLKLPEEEFESSSEYMDVVDSVENTKVALVDL